jgi:hypothetical protein
MDGASAMDGVSSIEGALTTTGAVLGAGAEVSQLHWALSASGGVSVGVTEWVPFVPLLTGAGAGAVSVGALTDAAVLLIPELMLV